MAGAGARASVRAKRKETEPLDLNAPPRRDEVTVARLRIVPIGNTHRSTAARSGGTLQINCTVQPVHDDARAERRARPEAPEVVYAQPVWSAPKRPASEIHMPEWPRPRNNRAEFADMPTTVMPAPRQNLADLQLRAVHALAGLQAGLNTLQARGIDLRKWSKSSLAWTAAVGAYAVVLFLIAILTS